MGFDGALDRDETDVMWEWRRVRVAGFPWGNWINILLHTCTDRRPSSYIRMLID